MTESKDSGAEIFLGFLFLPLSILLRGVVVSFMWAWFVVPLGVMPIGKAHALGISGLLSLLTINSEESDKSFAAQVFGSFIQYGVVLGFAYLWHSLM